MCFFFFTFDSFNSELIAILHHFSFALLQMDTTLTSSVNHPAVTDVICFVAAVVLSKSMETNKAAAFTFSQWHPPP